jgi:AraC-like DNA-binding protein/mannose-6-phosphate isomerase-like protein (cupin superfamily)
MPKDIKSIPIKAFSEQSETGIVTGKTPPGVRWDETGHIRHSHRHDFHTFLFTETGTAEMEIDFKKYRLKPNSVLYIRPYQVHRLIKATNVVMYFLGCTNENLKPEYRKLLEHIAPAQLLTVTRGNFPTLAEALTLCIRLSERTADKLYASSLKDSCNAIVALTISRYAEQQKTTPHPRRVEKINDEFRSLLEYKFTQLRRPADYARDLNITTSYLNECVKEATGSSVSHHIQQRSILEAKRLLCHSDKTVKEIAAELGYDDYAYFSRLFTKVAGMTAVTFRSKNRD